MVIRIEFVEITFGHAQLLAETIKSFQNENFRTNGSEDHEQQSGTDMSLKGGLQTWHFTQLNQSKNFHDITGE